MSLLTQALVFDRYGARLTMEQLAEAIGPGAVISMTDEAGVLYADYRDVANYLDQARAKAREVIVEGEPCMPVAVPVVVRTPRLIEDVRTALYRHFDAQGALLYVGVSLSPMSRLATHDLQSHWSKVIASVNMEWFPSRSAALAAELQAIRDEKPAHNIAGRGD